MCGLQVLVKMRQYNLSKEKLYVLWCHGPPKSSTIEDNAITHGNNLSFLFKSFQLKSRNADHTPSKIIHGFSNCLTIIQGPKNRDITYINAMASKQLLGAW
jgi:hypothetical protein